jgi:hypothetical protein
MNMDINIKTIVNIETEFFSDNNEIKTKPTDIGDWWGDEICKELDINSELKKLNLVDGKYKIKITIENDIE